MKISSESRISSRNTVARISALLLASTMTLAGCGDQPSAERCYTFPVGLSDKDGDVATNIRDAGMVVLKEYLGATTTSLESPNTRTEGLSDVVSGNIKLIAAHRNAAAYPTDIIGMKVTFNTAPFLDNGGTLEAWTKGTTPIDTVDDHRTQNEVLQYDCKSATAIGPVPRMTTQATASDQ